MLAVERGTRQFCNDIVTVRNNEDTETAEKTQRLRVYAILIQGIDYAVTTTRLPAPVNYGNMTGQAVVPLVVQTMRP